MVEQYQKHVGYMATHPVVMSGAGLPRNIPQKYGDVYVDTNSGVLWQAMGTSSILDWLPVSGVYRDSYVYSDDFHWYISPHFWTGTATDGTIAVGDEAGGILTLTTHTDNTDLAVLAGTKATQNWNDAGTYFGMKAKLNRITQAEFYVGVTSHASDPEDGSSNSYYFHFDSATNAGNIYCDLNTAGTVTEHDSGIDLVADTYHVYEIYDDGTNVNFYIDGVSVLAHAEIADGFVGRPLVKCVNKTGAAVHSEVDYAAIAGPR